MIAEREPIDVWLRFDADDSDEAEAEANTFETDYGRYCVEWYLNAVGIVSYEYFDRYYDACAWLRAEGFEDYSA